MSHRLNNEKYLAGRWRLNGHGLDSSGNGNHGTLVNTPTWGTFNRGLKTCLVLDGATQHVTLGDLTYLNSVSALTVCFWMNQDVLDVLDYIFMKFGGANDNIQIHTQATGRFEFWIENASVGGAWFDYSTIMSANNWHHVAMVFDGSGAADIDRLIVYVDGVPATLAFIGTIPATTSDLSGFDARIGWTSSTFDGKLYEFRIFTCSLSRDEVNTVLREPLQAR